MNLFIDKNRKVKIIRHVMQHRKFILSHCNSYIEYNLCDGLYIYDNINIRSFFEKNEKIYREIVQDAVNIRFDTERYNYAERIFYKKETKKLLQTALDKLNYVISRMSFYEQHFPTLKFNAFFVEHFKQVMDHNRQFRFVKNNLRC